MIVLDASAIVSIMLEEADASMLSERLDTYETMRFASAVTIWEAACAVARTKAVARTRGLALVQEFVQTAGIEPVAPDMGITTLAIEAADRYGIGPGYPGILNLGDCFSYATAKYVRAALLFKGDDFGRTDVTPA